MKANITLELSKDDLNYELENLISEIASDQINSMVRKTAEELVRKEVQRIIAPIVDNYLETALVGREYEYHGSHITRRPVDEFIKRVIIDYLDEPCYVYDDKSSKLHEKYNTSSHGGSKTTRAELWVIEKARKYTKEELFGELDKNIENKLKTLLPTKDEINEIIKSRLAEKFV
jgi:hypothetical protein